jgi:hypothetical protein
MTAARRKRKRCRVCYVAAAAFAALFAVRFPALARVTQQIVVDWHSGLAIGGYDPVAFFTAGRPVAGSGEFELPYDGVVWRFSNGGNLAAFAQRPDIYMPQYGGYDPVSAARGVAVPGNPDVWAIVGERLFLFHNGAQREKFLADSARLIATSQRRWPDVARTLDP